MKIKISKVTDEWHIKRTEQLLRLVRRKFGPEVHLLVKKILLVSLYVNYYQEKYHRSNWIGYHEILARNERIAINWDSKTPHMTTAFIVANSIYTSFLGVPSEIIKDPSYTVEKVEETVDKCCKQEIAI